MDLSFSWVETILKNIGYIFNTLNKKYEINTSLVPIGGWKSF